MRNLKRLLAGVGLAIGVLPLAAVAQQPTVISGRVASDAGQPLQGASVGIPSLGVGAYTQADGRYSFTVPAANAGQTVQMTARRIGFEPRTVSVALNGGAVTQDFTLPSSVTQLTGVVVTALGREVEKSTLGTAQQQITASELTQTRAMNVVQQVQGKVSGVQITGSGTQGGSTNIIIRGQNALTSNNQPLFVVDGVPMSNANRGGNLVDGFDFGNAISDLNPDDIETFTVLKGPNAAALYGSRAANGVIVITTKRASAGQMRTEASASYSWDRPSLLPDFQDRYGQGAGGSFEFVNGYDAGDCDYCDQSWGPKLDGRLICQFNSPRDSMGNCTPTPWVAHPNNVSDFFQWGNSLATNVAVSGGNDRAAARMSVGMDNVNGYVPNNFFQKTTALLNGNLQVSPRLSTNASLQYVRNNGRNRPGTGYLGSIMEQFFWFGRQVDIEALRNYRQGSTTNSDVSGREYNWNYNYHNNPWWLQYENAVIDSRDRFVGQASATYRFTDWLNATLRSGSDIFRFNVDQRFSRGNLTYAHPSYEGGFSALGDYRNEHNTELLFNVARDLFADLSFTATAGGSLRREYFSSNTMETAGLLVGGIYNPSNAAITPTLGQFVSRRAVNSMYGSASGTYKGFWTVEVTGRNDWSSTLPAGQNSYFYPSINTSVVLSELPMLQENDYVSFLKLRGSIARVGNDTDPYRLITTYAGNPNQFGGRPQFSLNDVLLDPNLKPELTTSTEAGIEAGLFGGRLTADFTVYNKRTSNQIYQVPVSSTSGYSQKLINAGIMENAGFEMLLSGTPVQRQNFSWTSTVNFSRNRNKVVELYEGVSTIVLGNGLFGDVRLEARQGQPYGAIWGGGFLYDSQGRLLTSGGIPVQTDTFVYHGSIQPDWTGGFTNQFTYRGMSLGVTFDIRRGGKIMSYTNLVGEYSGVLESTLRGREVDWDDPGLVIPGWDIDTDAANNIRVTAEEYYQHLFGSVEPYVYDASYVKLREIRFGFDVPQAWANRLRVQSASVAFTGRNLALWTDVPNIDPEFAFSSGNFQGIEYAIPANPRSFGFSVRLTP